MEVVEDASGEKFAKKREEVSMPMTYSVSKVVAMQTTVEQGQGTISFGGRSCGRVLGGRKTMATVEVIEVDRM